MPAGRARSLALCLASFLLAAPAGAGEAGDTILILDASGSMWGSLGGETKIEAARRATHDILATWPPEMRIGLMSYGHRRKADCADIEMLAPVAPLDAAALGKAVDGLTPKGKTPISDALTMAAAQLKSQEGKASIILVSDGIETCKGDPCAVAESLKAEDIGLTAHVIGFDIGDAKTRAQLQCIADRTGGKYFDAKDADGLKDALGKATDAAHGQDVEGDAPEEAETGNLRLTFALAEGLDPIVTQQATAEFGWKVEPANGGESREYFSPVVGAFLEPGDYAVSVEFGNAKAKTRVSVPPKGQAEANLILDAGFVSAVATPVVAGEGADGAGQFYWRVSTAAAPDETLNYSFDARPRFILPAGDYILKVTRDDLANAEQPLRVEPGDALQPMIDLRAGIIAYEAEGASLLTVETADTLVSITESSGKRAANAGNYRISAWFGDGDPVVRDIAVEMGKTVTVTMKPR